MNLIRIDVETGLVHKSEMANLYLRSIGIEEEEKSPIYPVDEKLVQKARDAVGTHFKSKIHFIAIIVGCNPSYPEKKWPIEYYQEFCEKYSKGHDDVGFLFVGNSDDEIEEVNRITDILPEESYLNLFYNDYETSRAYFAICEKVIGIDSGGLHIASTVEGPKIYGLFGPYNPRLTGPIFNPDYNTIVAKTDCIFCGDWRTSVGPKTRKCTDYSCMRAILPNLVLNAVDI